MQEILKKIALTKVEQDENVKAFALAKDLRLISWSNWAYSFPLLLGTRFNIVLTNKKLYFMRLNISNKPTTINSSSLQDIKSVHISSMNNGTRIYVVLSGNLTFCCKLLKEYEDIPGQIINQKKILDVLKRVKDCETAKRKYRIDQILEIITIISAFIIVYLICRYIC
jgi:hypothetical protein